jgi:tetratricopeptide (TPR) repeat protein
LELWDEAEVYLERAREYYETVSELKFIADSYFELAIATKNESYVSKALHMYESLESIKMTNVVKQYHALYIQTKKNYSSAVDELERVAYEFEKLGEIGTAVFILANAVMVCVEHKNIDLACRLLQKATDRKDMLGEERPYDVALFYRAKSAVCLRLEDFDSCLHYARLASDLYATIDMYSDSADSLEFVIEAYHRLGMLDAAFEESRKANALLRRSRRYDD